VVIAIIAILAALLLSALSTAKAKAHTIVCTSNLKQLGLAMQMYGEDNRNLLPMAHEEVVWDCTNPYPWLRPVAAYYQNTNILRCPSLSRCYEKSPYSYFLGCRAAFVEANYNHASVNLQRILFPAQHILSGDANATFSDYDADPDNYTVDVLFANKSPIHNHRVNVLFGDWHVKAHSKFTAGEMTYSYTTPGVNFLLDGL
jgi:prepilin-type processing-associated H-X9-DG protein